MTQMHLSGSQNTPEAGPGHSGRLSALHIIVIALSLAMTLGIWQYSKEQVARQTQSRFDASVDRLIALIEDRMTIYEDALRAGVSAIESHGGDISRDRWHIFANTLRLKHKYPGINGIGVIHFLNEDMRAGYLAQRVAERPGFEIFPSHQAGILMPISFIEPEAGNEQALGLDVAHETNRRTAALASRDTGTAQITGPIVLVQDAGHTPGFLFYAPFYLGEQPDNVAQRRETVVGAVYAPFVMRNLMEGLLARELRDVRFSISDQSDVLYDEHASHDSASDPEPLFSKQATLDMYGRQWVLDLRTDMTFRAQNSLSQPTLILLCGLVIEVLVIALLALMSRANARTVAYADKVTAQLRQQTRELEVINHDLEQFAYITSHDLKTPIRGIGGLTEIVKEDLEGYFASSAGNPEVSENLDRILDRVVRMNALTEGIMQLARVGEEPCAVPPLLLSEANEAMVFDFDLRSDQLSLDSDVSLISFDPSGLRRILENLVGNAVKYHDGSKPLHITISAKTMGERYQFTVSDNGPGIDPRYHSKIFDVFQTLRLNGAAESTGIGLAIVKKSVERHGGQIRLHSETGQGAAFEFDWPVSDSLHEPATTRKAA